MSFRKYFDYSTRRSRAYRFCAIIFVLCLAITLVLCTDSISNEEIEIEFERVMGVDIPSTFEVLSAKRSIGIDISAQYTIKFRGEEFLAIVDKLDLSKWDNSYNEDIYSLRLRADERDSYAVNLIMEKNILHLVYLHD